MAGPAVTDPVSELALCAGNFSFRASSQKPGGPPPSHSSRHRGWGVGLEVADEPKVIGEFRDLSFQHQFGHVPGLRWELGIPEYQPLDLIHIAGASADLLHYLGVPDCHGQFQHALQVSGSRITVAFKGLGNHGLGEFDQAQRDLALCACILRPRRSPKLYIRYSTA